MLAGTPNLTSPSGHWLAALQSDLPEHLTGSTPADAELLLSRCLGWHQLRDVDVRDASSTILVETKGSLPTGIAVGESSRRQLRDPQPGSVEKGKALLVYVVPTDGARKNDELRDQYEKLIDGGNKITILVAGVDAYATQLTIKDAVEPKIRRLLQVSPLLDIDLPDEGLPVGSLIKCIDRHYAPAVTIFAVSDRVPLLFQLALGRVRAAHIREHDRISFWKLPLGGLTNAEIIEEHPVTDVDPRGAFVRGLIEFLAKDEGPILLEGRTGTGKTQTARLIHDITRPGPRFRVVNCGALQSHDERESLFRGVAGRQFTGVEKRESIFEECDNGTVVLDDFQDYPVEEQVTLLDLLTPFSTRVRGRSRLGKASEVWTADVQVILAVNRDADNLFREGKLRQDIFSRVQRRYPRLPALRSKLDELKHEPDVQRLYLRLVLLEMQERSVTVRGPRWLKSVDPVESLRKQLQLDEDWRPLRRRVPSEDMPISDNVLNHPWPGNFRDLLAFARGLRNASNQAVGRWTLESADNVLAGTPAGQEAGPRAAGSFPEWQEFSPTQLMARAFFRAVTKPSATQLSISNELIVNPRPLREMLKIACGRKAQSGPSARRAQAWVAHLNEEDREHLWESACRLLDGNHRRRNWPVSAPLGY